MKRKDFIGALLVESKRFRLCVTEDETSSLFDYYKELFEWNRRINLISKSDKERFVKRHLLDSLSIERYIKIKKGDTLLDIGSGNGLPGIPIAIRFPESCVTLLEANRKKCVFIQHIIAKLQLTNVKLICDRFEKIYSDIDKFSVVFVRGVRVSSQMQRMLEFCLQKRGKLVLFVGKKGSRLNRGLENSVYRDGIDGRGFIIISKR